MHITTQFAPLSDLKADWLIVGVWEEEAPSGAVFHLDTQLHGLLSRLCEKGDVTGKANELTPLLDCPGIAAERVMVVGLGKKTKCDRPALLAATAAASRAVTDKARNRLALALPENVPNIGLEDVTALCGVGLMQGCLGPGLRKSKQERFPPQELVLVGPAFGAQEEVRRGAQRAEIEGNAVGLARELVNTPPCDLYPETFAQRAEQVAQAAGVACEVFDEKRLADERMNALLAVARGSARPPRLVVLRYQGGDPGKTLGWIGKGVTFDSGGLSLKTNEQMVDMKCDMAGAAAVLAAVGASAALKLPVSILGVLALVENLPSGTALKLGDVLQARNGKTIEVLNTDAEGRLILADALSYAVDQKAAQLVDLATLTGACMIALGTEVAGVMSNDEAWQDVVLAAATRAGERAWPLPMFPLYGELIKSDVADMKNTGGTRYGGAISAAKFLEEFVGEVPWVHLDIAGPAWAEKESATHDSGGTGCLVRTLVELGRGHGARK